MLSTRSIVSVVIAITFFLVAPAIAVPAQAATERVTICHALGNGDFQLMTVSVKALPAHTAHGDGLIGEAVPGMDGYVFGEGCTPEEVPPESEPVTPGCYDSTAGWGDLQYIGPANTAGNVIAWASTNGTCSVFEVEDRDAVVSAPDEGSAAALCQSLGLSLGVGGPLAGAVLSYPGFPADAWYCNAPD